MTNPFSILKGERCIWSEEQPEYREHIKKQRHHFVDTCPYSQIYGLSSSHAWMWELNHEEWWALKKWCFQTVCWRRLLRVPWAARRSNQSLLKEINSEYSLEGLMLKLKGQYFATWCEEPAHWERSWCWERLKAGGEGDDRGWDGWMTSLTQCTWVWVSSGGWWWTGRPGVLQFMESQRAGHNLATEQQEVTSTQFPPKHFH